VWWLLTSSSIWLFEFVIEWIDLVSMELDWVSRNVTNFVMVMLRFVARVVTIVVVLLFVDMLDFFVLEWV